MVKLWNGGDDININHIKEEIFYKKYIKFSVNVTKTKIVLIFTTN